MRTEIKMQIEDFVAEVKRRAYGGGDLFMSPEEACKLLGILPSEFKAQYPILQEVMKKQKIVMKARTEDCGDVVYVFPDRGCSR